MGAQYLQKVRDNTSNNTLELANRGTTRDSNGRKLKSKKHSTKLSGFDQSSIPLVNDNTTNNNDSLPSQVRDNNVPSSPADNSDDTTTNYFDKKGGGGGIQTAIIKNLKY